MLRVKMFLGRRSSLLSAIAVRDAVHHFEGSFIRNKPSDRSITSKQIVLEQAFKKTRAFGAGKSI